MTRDVVVDANVLGHSQQIGQFYCEASIVVLAQLLSSDRLLALDDTGKQRPALETSRMYLEYWPFLLPGSVAAGVLTALALEGRVVFLDKCDLVTRRVLSKLVPNNKADAVVLGVAVQSMSRLLVSNDFEDFTDEVREAAKELYSVVLVDSDGGSGMI